MTGIEIREATADDIATVERFLRSMLHDLSAIGGQELLDEDTNWLSFENRIRQGLEAADHRFK